MKNKRLLYYLFIAGLAFFLFFDISKNWKSLSKISWHFNFSSIILLIISTFAIYIVNIIAWHITTKSLGVNLSFKKNFHVWIISNASRLLPGGVWQYPGRVILLNRSGISKKIGVVAVLMEALFTLSFGAITFLFSLFFWQIPSISTSARSALVIFLFSPLLVLFLITKKGMKLVLFFISKLKKDAKLISHINFDKKWLVPMCIAYFLKFLIIGFALYILILTAVPLTIHDLPFVVGSYALSWIIGYLTIFAPGGIGVTELSLAGIMSFRIDFSLAFLIAVLFRLILLVSEAILISIALFLSKVHNGEDV